VSCEFQLDRNKFERNTATQKGGGYFYNKFRPTTNSDSFVDNDAPYGPDMASYPFDIEAIRLDSEKAASGHLFPGAIEVRVVDVDGNYIPTDNSR